MALAGGLSAARVLSRRRTWEQTNRQVAICLDLDDVQSAAIRAGLSLDELLARLASAGASHVSLPEWTLNRLEKAGRLVPVWPAQPRPVPPTVGHWNYASGPATLLECLAEELAARLPWTGAEVLRGRTLVYAGARETVGELGLGFDAALTSAISRSGLLAVPRPVSYPWPEKALLERTLAQAAALGSLVAFDGAMILGHEMHLDETVATLAAHDLTFVYFAESRHQKGDWFVAKRRAPAVVLGHAFTPQEMIPLDFHAAAHRWVQLARERGIRFCYVNLFKVLHATDPLECLTYVEHLREGMRAAGFSVGPEARPPTAAPAPAAGDLALTALVPAGAAAAILSRRLALGEPAALALTAAGAAGAAALPFAERWLLARRQAAHGGGHAQQSHGHSHGADRELGKVPHHDHAEDRDHPHHSNGHERLAELYAPSYAPKLLALAAAAFSPLAAAPAPAEEPAGSWLAAVVYPAAGAAALAALTSGPEYELRIEEYRGFNLDWLLPLAGSALAMPDRAARLNLLALLGAAWWAARRLGLDALAALDPAHAEGHTHHISAAQRALGDLVLAAGPRPGRKWAGLGPAGHTMSWRLAALGRVRLAVLAALVGADGDALGLAAFRRPERALAETLPLALPGYVAGSAAAALIVRLPVR
jgi:hypothetical protein